MLILVCDYRKFTREILLFNRIGIQTVEISFAKYNIPVAILVRQFNDFIGGQFRVRVNLCFIRAPRKIRSALAVRRQ